MTLSLRTKFSLLILPLVGIAILLLVMIVAPYRAIPKNVNQLKRHVARTVLTAKMARHCTDQVKEYSLMVLRNDPKHWKQLTNLHVNVQQDFLELTNADEILPSDADRDAFLAETKAAYDRFRETGEKINLLMGQGKRDEAKAVVRNELNPIQENVLRPHLEQLLQKEAASMKGKLQEIEGMEHFLVLAPSRLHQAVHNLDAFIDEAMLAENFGRLFSVELDEYSDYCLFPDEDQRHQSETARATAENGLLTLIQHVQKFDSHDPTLPTLGQLQLHHQSIGDLEKQGIRALPQASLAQANDMINALESLDTSSVTSQVDEVSAAQQGDLEGAVRNIAADAYTAMIIIGVVSLCVLLIGIGSPWLLTKKIVQPIIELKEAANRLGAGDLHARVPVHSQDEIGQLGTTFNSMAEKREQAEHVLKEFTLKLERSNRELQDFASVASHDLQEPLRKIQAFGDRLKTKYQEALGTDGKDYLERMLNAASRMQSLINDLLTFSRVTTKAQPFAPVDLGKITREVLSDLEIRIQQSGGRVEMGELPTIEADPLQMRQLIQNLVGNALKFFQPGVPPLVTITSPATNNGHCEILVADNGIGFDEKYLDKIFAVFQRLHGRNTYEGTGIGLAVCRKIAERHGGSITAKSQPGKGATFIVTLPTQHNHGGNHA